GRRADLAARPRRPRQRALPLRRAEQRRAAGDPRGRAGCGGSGPALTRYGSDVIVDLLIEAGIEHVAFNPGASFRGIHDSLVHREGAPAIALCTHEAIAVSIANGYARVAGKPMAALLHDVVGLQNATA